MAKSISERSVCSGIVPVALHSLLAISAPPILPDKTTLTPFSGAKGVKVVLSGRIGGAEIARREWRATGTMPLHTLRSDIDFAIYPALTKSGYVGVKVWINKGEVKI